MKGHIRSISDRNFGFIKTEQGENYFFHRDDFSGHWGDLLDDFQAARIHKEKIEVTFEPNKGPKGLRASTISRLDFPNQ